MRSLSDLRDDEFEFVMSLRIGNLVKVFIQDDEEDDLIMGIGNVNGIVHLYNYVEYGINLKGGNNIYPSHMVEPYMLNDEVLYSLDIFSFKKGFWVLDGNENFKLKKIVTSNHEENEPSDITYDAYFGDKKICTFLTVHELQNVLFDVCDEIHFFDSLIDKFGEDDGEGDDE